MRLVLIEWEDAAHRAGWSNIDEDDVHCAVKCESVGWLLHDGDDCKVVVASRTHKGGDETDQSAGEVIIPVGTITRIVDLHNGSTS